MQVSVGDGGAMDFALEQGAGDHGCGRRSFEHEVTKDTKRTRREVGETKKATGADLWLE